MFDDNHMEESDLLIRSVLGDAQEEVPAHVWAGVAGGLDRAAKRRSVILWLSRAGAVAAAAAVAVGVFLRHGRQEMLIPEAVGDMIVVVEDMPVAEDDASTFRTEAAERMASSESSLLANAVTHRSERSAEDVPVVFVEEEVTDAEAAESEKDKAGTAQKTDSRQDAGTDIPETITDDMDWEEEVKKDRIRASLVLSSVAGTNNPQNNGRIGPLKSPGIFKSPSKTTVEPTSAQTTYGIPVSFGAGVKLNFTKRWSLGMGLNYTLLTSKFNGKYTKVEDGIAQMPVTATINNVQHYVGIPINAYYNIIRADFINFYAYAGGAVEKCVADLYTIQTTPVIHHEEAVKGVQLSANAGIGVEFMLGRYVGLYIDPSLRYYFHCGQPKSIRTAQPLMLGFEMGLRFNL